MILPAGSFVLGKCREWLKGWTLIFSATEITEFSEKKTRRSQYGKIYLARAGAK